jgi:hypothetical protein
MKAWRREPGAAVKNAGSIHFEVADNGGTHVTVHMSYCPPAGALGHGIAALMGGDPKRELDKDLMRMKSFIESGIQPHDAAKRNERPNQLAHEADDTLIQRGRLIHIAQQFSGAENIIPTVTNSSLSTGISSATHPLKRAASNYDPLMDLIGEARFVLLSEASHGTHKFSHERVRITQRLIEEKGFAAVAAEADWPDVSAAGAKKTQGA